MDILNEEFACFKSTVNRMRWFVIALVMISMLILIHVYLEGFSFQDHQLKKVLGVSITNHSLEKQKCLEEIIKHVDDKDNNSNITVNDIYYKIDYCSEDKVGKDYLKKLNKKEITDISAAQSEYSENEFSKLLTENTIRNMHLNIRSIPLLGIEVPANDFVTVMSFMSFVFMIGMWMNLRGVLDSLNTLKKYNDAKLMSLAKMNTLFLTHLETSEGQYLAKIIRLGGIYFPLICVASATIYYCVKAMIQSESLPMNYVYWHCGFYFIVIIMYSVVVCECRHVIKEINGIFQTKNN